MTAELKRRARDEEDNFVERKSQGIKTSEVRETVCAFANSVPEGRTGVLFIGIGNGGAVVGCDNTDQVQQRVREAVNECYPPINWRGEVIELEGKKVVAIEVPASTNKPHFTGGAYIRQGSSTVKASDAQFTELVATRNSKAAAIIKLKGQVVTVIGVDHKVGSTRPMVGRHHESRECRIEECDALSYRLVQLNTGASLIESVERTELSYDYECGRPKLVVVGRK